MERKAMAGLLAMEVMSQHLFGKSFEEHIVDELSRMPKRYGKRDYSTGKPRPNAQGRNERCNCGSGKKYKQCCGKE